LSAHAWPSFAVPYAAVWLIIVPLGSSIMTLPLLFDKLKLVWLEKNAVNPCGASSVPAGKL
jgi:hypothetical protein